VRRADHAAPHLLGERGQISLGDWPHRRLSSAGGFSFAPPAERIRRPVAGWREDAVGHARVQVHVAVERGAEAVQEGDVAESRAGGCGRVGVTRHACGRTQESLDLYKKNLREGGDGGRAVGRGSIAAASLEISAEFLPDVARHGPLAAVAPLEPALEVLGDTSCGAVSSWGRRRSRAACRRGAGMRPEAGPRGKRGVGSDHGQTGAGTVYVIARALCAGCSPHQHPPSRSDSAASASAARCGRSTTTAHRRPALTRRSWPVSTAAAGTDPARWKP
jgi:hypothetical protein